MLLPLFLLLLGGLTALVGSESGIGLMRRRTRRRARTRRRGRRGWSTRKKEAKCEKEMGYTKAKQTSHPLPTKKK